MSYFIELARILVWPIVILLLIWVFRKPISSLINRVNSIKSRFLDVDTPVACRETEELGSQEWYTFWLGHDLMWTIDVLLRAGPKERIEHGLKCSVKNLRNAGLEGSNQNQQLEGFLSEITSATEEDLDGDARLRYARRLGQILLEVGQKVKEHRS